MILTNFFLKQKKYRSPASRKSFVYLSDNLIYQNFKKLTFKKLNKAGRSSSGKIIFRTRSSVLVKRLSININYLINKKSVGTIASFSFIPFKNKVLSLIFLSNGSIFYFLTTNKFMLFSFFCNVSTSPVRFKIKSFTTLHYFLYQLPKLSIVSALEIYPQKGIQYIRSTGTGGKLLAHDKNNYISLVKLPSGFKKIFSCYSFAFFEKIILTDNKYFKSNKAGFWIKYGIKQTVRGVAMNPVDHPHGGRTKSIKTPLTPWGKITKKK